MSYVEAGAGTSTPRKRNLRSHCCWSTDRFSSSTNMESAERLVFHHLRRDRDGFGNRVLRNFPGPFSDHFIPRQTLIQLIQGNPYHNARALEGGLPTADSGIRHNVPSQFDPSALCICLRLHAAAPNYAPATPSLRAARYGRASMFSNHDFGKPCQPVESATIPPTIAQLVSTSPPADAVAAIASG